MQSIWFLGFCFVGGLEIIDFGSLPGLDRPRGAGKASAGAPLDLDQFSARQTNSKAIPFGFLNPLVLALEIISIHSKH